MGNEFRHATQLLNGVSCILGFTDADDGLTRMAEELTVGVNPYDRFEFGLCRGEMYWADTLFVAAGGAGFRSIAQIQNDSTDYLVRIDAVTIDDGAAATGFQLGRTSTLATTDNGLLATARDGRYARPSVPAVRWRSQNGVALPAGFSNGMMWDILNAAGISRDITGMVLPMLLRPQGTFAVWSNTDNTTIRLNASGSVWRVNNVRELSP
jgi:hypothetical protein